MPKCDKFYPNCQWTVTYCWPNLALDTVLLTKVYWSYSTHIIRVCFTPLLNPTLKLDLKGKNNVKINFNSRVMASLYELLCYYSRPLRSDHGRSSYFCSFYTILTFFFPSNFNRSTRGSRWQFTRIFNFTMSSSHKFWNVQSQYN